MKYGYEIKRSFLLIESKSELDSLLELCEDVLNTDLMDVRAIDLYSRFVALLYDVKYCVTVMNPYPRTSISFRSTDLRKVLDYTIVYMHELDKDPSKSGIITATLSKDHKAIVATFTKYKHQFKLFLKGYQEGYHEAIKQLRDIESLADAIVAKYTEASAFVKCSSTTISMVFR